MEGDLILVADQSRARIFFRPHSDDDFEEISDFINPYEHLSEAQILTDGPGAPAAPKHHYSRSMPSENSVHRHGWESFAKALNEAVEHELHNHPNARISIIAPPRFIGILRKKMSTHVKEHLNAEVTHNLTMVTKDKLKESLPLYAERWRSRDSLH